MSQLRKSSLTPSQSSPQTNAIDDVDYLRSDAKYTIVAWRDGGKPAEAVVRTPLKELLEQLDAEQFAQVHRSVVVNLRAISHVKRHDNETAEIHVRGRDDVLPVSRNYLHLFRQMYRRSSARIRSSSQAGCSSARVPPLC
jgi:DNA-binding LytR/AlgR family response regulator